MGFCFEAASLNEEYNAAFFIIHFKYKQLFIGSIKRINMVKNICIIYHNNVRLEDT